MDKASLIFCAGVLAACLGIAALAIPMASISDSALARGNAVVEPEKVGMMDLGSFGKVSVRDLTDYYMENPPTIAAGTVRKVRFEGC